MNVPAPTIFAYVLAVVIGLSAAPLWVGVIVALAGGVFHQYVIYVNLPAVEPEAEPNVEQYRDVPAEDVVRSDVTR